MKRILNRLIKLISIAALFFVLSYVIVLNQNDFLKLIFPSKVWVHRVNSLDKKSQLYKAYPGIETDVEFDTTFNKFQINHPPAKPINLFLENYLESHHEGNKYWIDFKNLDSSNATLAFNQLDKVVKNIKFNYDDLIIESPNYKNLRPFKKAFKVSYYLPVGISYLDSDKLKVTTNNINSIIEEYKPDYISTSIVDYSIIHEEFNHDMLLWALSDIEIKNHYDFLNGIKLLKSKLTVLLDNKVKVLLIRDLVKNGER